MRREERKKGLGGDVIGVGGGRGGGVRVRLVSRRGDKARSEGVLRYVGILSSTTTP